MPALSPIFWKKWTRIGAPQTTSASGRFYLRDNPLLESRVERKHIKPRLLGHGRCFTKAGPDLPSARAVEPARSSARGRRDAPPMA